MFTDKMTVYNHYNNGYNRHVVEHIMWRHVREQTVVSNNVISKENSEHITIDCSKVRDYVPPTSYEGEGFTLNPAAKDIVVEGIVDDEITKDFTVSMLLKKYAGSSGIVTSVTDSRKRLLPIIKVVAK